MRILFFIPILLSSLFSNNNFTISAEQTTGHTFREDIHIAIDTVDRYEKEVNVPHLKLDFNLNNMLGVKYNQMVLSDSDKFKEQTLYYGSGETIYFSYTQGDKNIDYTSGTRVERSFDGNATQYTDLSDGGRSSKNEYTKYTFFDLLTYEKQSFFSTKSEEYDYFDGINDVFNATGDVYRTYKKEVWKLSTEDLYRQVKNDAMKKDDFLYFYGGSKKLFDNIKVYGILIASYEHHDYKEGKAYALDDEGEEVFVKAQWGDTADTALEENDQYDGISGKFKGFSYGYHITAQYDYKNFDFFLSLYSKTLRLKNYHDDVKNYVKTYAEGDDGAQGDEEYKYALGIIREPEIIIKDTHLSFGVSYTF